MRRAWQTMLGRAATSWAIATALFAAGLYLVGLPVLFTVFAHETDTGHHYTLRVVLMVVWFVCAVVVGLVATAGDVAELRRRAREASRRVGNRRELAALSSIAALLKPGAAGLPSSFRFDAFITDTEGNLVPVLERDPAPWQRWPPGHGVVGIAWQHPDSFVRAVGQETTDAALGLSHEQIEHYGHLTYVAAQVIYDELQRQVGVLAVSCSDQSNFEALDGPQKFLALASDMGIIIGDARPANRR